MQRKIILPAVLLALIALFGGAACTLDVRSDETAKASPSASPEKSGKNDDKKETKDADEEKSDEPEARTAPVEKSSKVSKSECLQARERGKRLIAGQTFPIDFEPFKGGCFVTFASVEDMVDASDVPRGSTFHIYKNGEIIYDLPDAFDGQSACWVEAVGFEDLNSDGKTDIIIAGKCLAARDSYPANAVFVNSRGDFSTDANANGELNDFTTVQQIVNYVKRNQGSFF